MPLASVDDASHEDSNGSTSPEPEERKEDDSKTPSNPVAGGASDND